MSSDSELEEFFDAEDVTPKHSFLESVEENVSPHNLEMEERALLVLKKRQEKRRQKEDHDLEMRLHSLILKRKEEKERILEQDRKEQLERRRRRHKELRRRITKKGDDSNESTSSTSESDESDLEIDSPDGIRVALPPDCKTLNNTPPREKDDFSVNINRSLPEKEKKQKQINDLLDSTDTLDDNISDPDKIAEAVALQNFLIVDGNEPDIVKSTKTRTPPNTLQAAVDPMPVSSQVGEPVYSQQQQPGQKQQQQNQSTGTFVEPVAPPRRKKKLKMTLGDVNNSENPCPRSSAVSLPADFVIEPASPGLPSETMTLGSSMERLELDLEQSLDLHSIIVGKRHINAEDAEMEAINSDQDSPRQTLEALSSKSSKTSSLERSFMDEKKGSKTSTLDRLSEDGKKSKGSTLDRSSQDGKKSKGSTLDRSSQDGKKSKGSTLDRSSRDGKKSKGSSLDRSSQDGKKSKGSTLDSSSQDGKKSKGSSLERSSQDGKIRKGSSLDRSSQDGRKSKGSSLDRPDGKKSKSSSLDTAEGKGSRASNLDKAELRRKHGSGRDSLPKHSGRPLSSSGKPLTDEEILGTFVVRNLDTGETTTLKDAEKEIEKCIDPLILHLMQRSKDLPRVEGLDKDEEDTRSEGGKSLSSERLRKKGAKLKRFIGKKVGRTVTKVKTAADQVMHGEENTVIEEEVSDDGRRFKFKANHNKKGPYDFGKIKLVQDLGGEHTGAIWTMKFSPCGRLLATGGQDCVLRIWVLESAYNYFDDMRQKYIEMEVSPAPSQESLGSIPSISETSSLDLGATAETEDVKKGPFRGKPFCKYRGHTADLLDTSWSKNYFILSSSMDKTVRLWHISRRECLCTFQHVDFVTAIVFHPKDDRYFLSGSLDGKLRLWNIPDKKVTLWNEVGGGNSSLITTANFCHNGKFAVVGTYDGKCIFFNTEVLVTSNDSRVRLYDLRDLTLTCKYKGPMNTSSQIRASFSPKGRYVISGSEDHFIYLWRTQHEFYKFSSARRDRNDYYEAVKVHNAVVTAAIFAPHPSHFVPSDDVSCKDKDASENQSQFIVSADFLGSIKVIKAK